ncbi:hypothetical protein [Limnoglobus roseus]|uniref:Uncharacterized protein n=1 Tax=Limnoglobus roseus TaxID=2598579 RepID=A0A5C1AB22_9BACT|nr:hypothetical protein [Limnoglobus roseus]QEL15775.1 hypothetical protein PX52LOC_02711 [Limnoglobus roseus]
MATPISPAELAQRFVRLLKERTATNDADEVRLRFQKTYEFVEGVFKSRSAAERDPVFHAFVDELGDPDLPIWEFACLANTCGIAIEHGADPGPSLDLILDRLTVQFRGVPELHERLMELVGTSNLDTVPEDQWQDLANRSPETAQRMREFLGIGFNGRAAMAILCRRADLRQQARGRDELIQAAVAGRQFNPYAHYLSEVLLASDDDDVLVIDLDRNLGFLARLHAVRNNAHLFTLLQDALLAHPTAEGWEGEKPSAVLASIAKGERMIDAVTPAEWQASGRMNDKGEVFDRAIWQFYQWPALQPDNTVETWEKAQPYNPWWVWSEMYPRDLVELDGMKIVLLAKPEMPRNWALGFFAPVHPALRSGVTIRSVLSAESVAGWLDRIRAMPREDNPLPPPGQESIREATVA